MARSSAGILLYRNVESGIELLIAHPGGPFWAAKDLGVWTIPKGEFEPGEDPLAAAEREFEEEVGIALPDPNRLALGEIRQSGGKRVIAWAVHGDIDLQGARSNTFEMEWPPRSGRYESYPEVDRLSWCNPDKARRKLLAAQHPFVDRLLAELSGPRHLSR